MFGTHTLTTFSAPGYMENNAATVLRIVSWVTTALEDSHPYNPAILQYLLDATLEVVDVEDKAENADDCVANCCITFHKQSKKTNICETCRYSATYRNGAPIDSRMDTTATGSVATRMLARMHDWKKVVEVYGKITVVDEPRSDAILR
ncbi:hypothetical protein PRIPAC_71298 [Pristionchus pacificus]|uniref:Uncharacterized protein n=1 Tax=Pristionchus pacificus TaxID=54126 RepID=A0A2A6CEX3_PRIPA|nr:hypothetical protein PRIPAC_71298 [Pristionchus pacificus]|eukprot:PDM76754.1 hypothetical protein PRIPAC_42149 [Pristionchus pacificus]